MSVCLCVNNVCYDCTHIMLMVEGFEYLQRCGSYTVVGTRND